MKKMRNFILLAVCIGISLGVKANVKPNNLFSNNAVLQQGVAVPVWGSAADNEKVSVEFAGQKLTTVSKGGKWMVKLQPLKAGGPFVMTIKGENTVTINNVMVGEVWLCSGQSNMVFELERVVPEGNSEKLADVIGDAKNYPYIRQFSIPLSNYSTIPDIAEDIPGGWNECNSNSVKKFSAVAYFFARDLYKKLNVPIGIINSSYGGTFAEQWISKESLEQSPELKKLLDNYEKYVSQYAGKLEKYKQEEPMLLDKWNAETAKAKADGTAVPRMPTPPRHPAFSGGPTGLYNVMIAPLVPYAIKGIAWYQGEQNAGRGLQYRELLPTLIKNWRSSWGDTNIPFLIVQLPAHKILKPEIREAQLLTAKTVPNTALIVTTDCHTDTTDIHPRNKQPVGERLALAARGLAYKEKIEFEGPVYESFKIDNGKVILSFTHTGSGLMTKDNTSLKDFIIAGSDKKFYAAQAYIKGNKVIVYSPEVKNPVAVRLGWNTTPIVNLYNKEGLLATSFRTDVE